MSKSSRIAFETDGASIAASAVQDHVSLASPSSALARFEFEHGKGNEGTKILMVEWEEEEEEEEIRQPGMTWHVTWEGKSTVLPANDQPVERKHRLYFLLPPGVAVPPHVTITRKSSLGSDGSELQQSQFKINSLPAIFPPELGASALTSGKKGVLHTIWAKKRLSVLQKEIDNETRVNVEGIGLEMALSEKNWIEQNFGLEARAGLPILSPLSITGKFPQGPASPTSPRSPGGGRLAEKLKGLRVGTSVQELSARPPVANPLTAPLTAALEEHLSCPPHENNPLSPEISDVAVSSFSAFHGLAQRPQLPPKQDDLSVKRAQPRTFAAAAPPASLVAQQERIKLGGSSLDSLARDVHGEMKFIARTLPSADEDDELFAVAMSPRSPDMAKSPFSFSTQDTARWKACD
ncbi:MAG: hypothetical protein M1829_001701 [Trizodia sp. TS-e1964]|nr:MAG: hypothetical protein M1829_001701 [Trizodia sp. TS-e1964]